MEMRESIHLKSAGKILKLAQFLKEIIHESVMSMIYFACCIIWSKGDF